MLGFALQAKEAQPQASQHARRIIVFLCVLAGYLIQSGNDKPNLLVAAQLHGAIEKLNAQAGIGFNTFYQELNLKRIQLAKKKISAAEWQRVFETGSGWERGEAIQQAKQILTR